MLILTRAALAVLLSGFSILFALQSAQAQCSGTPYKSGNGEWVTNLVPCGNSGRGNGGSSGGGGGSNNAAAAVGAAGAALGILGSLIEESERQQENQNVERENRAARARWAYCENYVRQARTAVNRGASSFNNEMFDDAIDHYSRAISLLSHCENRKNIALVRKWIQDARQAQAKHIEDREKYRILNAEQQRRDAEEAARERDRIKQNESVAGYSKFFGSNENYWRDQNGRPPLSSPPAQSSFSTDATTPLSTARDRLRREEEIAYLRRWRSEIEQMPPGPYKDSLKKKFDEEWRIANKDEKPVASTNKVAPSGSAGSRTCAIVNGIWTCSNDYNIPALVPPTDIRANATELNPKPLPPKPETDERLQGIPDGKLDYSSANTRPIIIPDSEVKAAADKMRNEINQK